MNVFVKKIETFLHENTVWFFLTGILLIVSGWLMPDFSGKTWGDYFGFILSMLVQYSPILLFAFFRNDLREKLPKIGYAALWVLTFIGFLFLNHPFVYETLGISAFGSVPMHDGFVPLIICGLLLLTELILQSNDFIVRKTSGNSLLKKIDLDHLVILFLLIYPFIQLFGIHVFLATTGEECLTTSEFFTEIVINYIKGTFGYFLYFINRRFLIPSFLKKKGIVYYGAIVVAITLISYPISAQISQLLQAILGSRFFQDINIFVVGFDFTIFTSLLFSAPVIIIFEWFKQSTAIANLEKEKSETELNLLKQQINPHFFFNTLNNLYALSLTKDEQTPEVILQLSELMRYVIYKGKEKEVALAEEVKYIEDYVQLQQIRLAKKLDFKFEKTIDDPSVRVPPLLFINLVENAFKHGIEPAEGDCFLHLRLESTNGNLSFVCENSLEETPINSETGTGLKNLKRRLELRFPGRHELKISEAKNIFNAKLKIEF